MRKTVLFVSIMACVLGLAACQKAPEDPNAVNMDKDTSYSMGMYMGMIMSSQMQLPPIRLDYQSFLEGFRAYNESLETKFTMEEGGEKINAALMEYLTRMGMLDPEAEAAATQEDSANVEAGKAFLAANGAREGVTTTASGLQYEVLVEGSGPKPLATDTVQVHYEGTLIDGTVFDSSYARNEPIEFPLDGVIQGWSEGVQLMNEGSTYNLYIPSELGYGPYRTGDIPGNSTLIFKVELIDIK